MMENAHPGGTRRGQTLRPGNDEANAEGIRRRKKSGAALEKGIWEEANIKTGKWFSNKINVDKKLQEVVGKVIHIMSDWPICHV